MSRFLNLTARALQCLCLGAVAHLATPALAADPYPNRPVVIVNPWSPGGPSDAIIRPIAQKLSVRLRQNFLVENKTGANGTIGTAAVARAKPDGYTLLFANVNPLAISPAMPQKPPYDSLKDFVPITQIAAGPNVLVVRSDFPAKTLPELIAIAKSKPGALSYGSVGIGSNTHLAASLLSNLAKVEMVHVPYRGAEPIQVDLLGGQITTAFVNLGGALGMIREGKLRPLAVSTGKRSNVLPNVPTVAETLPGFDISGWYGLMAPAQTPPEIVKVLHKEVNDILREPETVERLRAAGMDAQPSSPEAFGRMLAEELQRWASAVKSANLD